MTTTNQSFTVIDLILPVLKEKLKDDPTLYNTIESLLLAQEDMIRVYSETIAMYRELLKNHRSPIYKEK